MWNSCSVNNCVVRVSLLSKRGRMEFGLQCVLYCFFLSSFIFLFLFFFFLVPSFVSIFLCRISYYNIYNYSWLNDWLYDWLICFHSFVLWYHHTCITYPSNEMWKRVRLRQECHWVTDLARYRYLILLIDWLIDWLSDWLSGWLIDWLIDRLIVWLIIRLVDCLDGWLVDWLIDWWLIIKLID